MANKLIATMGIPGCGKSTWVSRQWFPPVKVVNTDAIRVRLTGNLSDQSRNDEVFATAYTEIEETLAVGNDVIFDSTALSRNGHARRTFMIDIAKKHNAEAELHVFRVPFDVCLERNNGRPAPVPFGVMIAFLQLFTEATHSIGTEAWDRIIFHD